jgi:hypothetical protein
MLGQQQLKLSEISGKLTLLPRNKSRCFRPPRKAKMPKRLPTVRKSSLIK